MTKDFKLPLVGLGTCYCEFSKENPDAGVRRLLLNFDRMKDALSAFPIYERIVCAHACHDLGRKEESYVLYRGWIKRGSIYPPRISGTRSNKM